MTWRKKRLKNYKRLVACACLSLIIAENVQRNNKGRCLSIRDKVTDYCAHECA